MKFAFTKEHLDFFYRHHHIEFENLLSKEDVKTLKDAITATLATRLNTQIEKLKYQPLKTLYLSGFDTWRNSNAIKKILFRPHLAEVVSNLVKKKPLRMGFDQAFYTPITDAHSSKDMPALFKKETSLSQISCLQGIACGLILHLEASAVPTETSELSIAEGVQTLIPIPRKTGSGIFFSPDAPLSLEHLMLTPGIFQILIAYAVDTTLYRHCEDDSHTHAYKKLGYVFGDKIKNTSHPFLYKG